MMKKRDEIKNIVKACEITTKILKQTIKNIKSFETELDVYNFLKQKTKENNCKLAFKPIVAIGKNASEIHHKVNKTKIKKGFLVIDFGVKYNGFCSDCTRTIYIGKPSKKDKDLYSSVLNSQLTAIKELKPGSYAHDIDSIARATLKDVQWKFIHGTGHGVGKRIHQAPNLKPNSKSIIKKDKVITIEPGVYFKNKLGIRIEDTILIKDKPIILTKLTKELIVI
jgi:Xaa-Pro aminopeptidase